MLMKIRKEHLLFNKEDCSSYKRLMLEKILR